MPRHHVLAQACLWAAAIIGAALLGAPRFLTGILLPVLATCALLPLLPRRQGLCFGVRQTPPER
ncbi:MAG: hypothetical protein V4463_23035 [Pseudomonadota bacterium]